MSTSTFVGWVTRMPSIKRWSLIHCYKEENISEHSHIVAIIAHLLAVIKNELFDGDVSPERAATVAIYHEMSEAYGDLSSVVKYSSPEFTEVYKKLEGLAEKRCVESLPEKLQNTFKSLIIQTEVDPVYKKIVKVADEIAGYIKAVDEHQHNNPEFKYVVERLDLRIEHLKNESPEAKYFIDTFLPSCVVTLDELTGLS
jgi:5'-deoxynucleotidase